MAVLKSYDGSTFMEAIVAMVIMSVIVGISALVFQNFWDLGVNNETMSVEREVHYFSSNPTEALERARIEVFEEPSRSFSNMRIQTTIGLSTKGDTLYELKKMVPNEVE